MASAEQYADWIVKNASKRGTPEFDTVAQAYKLARSQSSQPAAPPDAAPNPSEGGGTLQFGPLDTGIKTSQWLDRGLSGVGKAFSDVGMGMQQVGAGVMDVVDPRQKNLSDLVLGNTDVSRVGAMRKKVEESRRLDAPLMETTAGKVGNVGGNVAMLAPTALIPGANTVTGAGTIGAIAGLAQPSASTGETVGNVLLGGAGGAGGQYAMNGIARIAGQQGNAITQGQRASAQGGQRLGMRLSPGNASGSQSLQRIEAAAEANPITSGGFDAIKRTNQRVLNREAARAIGENADELSTPVLHAANQRIGAVFDSVADATPVRLDPQQVGARLRQIAHDSDGMLMGNADLAQNGLWRRLDGFVNDAGGASREQLRQLSSNLGKAGRTNMTTQNGDRALGEALFQAQEVVEDAIQGTLTQAQQQAYATAREQYRNLITMTAKTNIVNPSNGNVSGRSLATTLMQKDRGGFTMGGNNTGLYDAARFAQAFPQIVGDSGTATRSMNLTDYAMAVPGNLLSRLYLSQPVAAAAGAGAGAVGTGARLANNRLAAMLAQPAGVAGGLQLSNLFQE